MNKLMNEQINERMNEQTNKQTNEWTSKWTIKHSKCRIKTRSTSEQSGFFLSFCCDMMLSITRGLCIILPTYLLLFYPSLTSPFSLTGPFYLTLTAFFHSLFFVRSPFCSGFCREPEKILF